MALHALNPLSSHSKQGGLAPAIQSPAHYPSGHAQARKVFCTLSAGRAVLHPIACSFTHPGAVAGVRAPEKASALGLCCAMHRNAATRIFLVVKAGGICPDLHFYPTWTDSRLEATTEIQAGENQYLNPLLLLFAILLCQLSASYLLKGKQTQSISVLSNL